MTKKIFFLSLIVVLIAVVIYNQGGKTNNVRVSLEKSSKFSEGEMNDAVDSVKKKFKDFDGCKLTKIWYSEQESNKSAKDYLKYGRGAENHVSAANVIVLFSNFNVDSSGGDGSFEPNSTESGWQWVLIRDSKSENWRVDDWGY